MDTLKKIFSNFLQILPGLVIVLTILMSFLSFIPQYAKLDFYDISLAYYNIDIFSKVSTFFIQHWFLSALISYLIIIFILSNNYKNDSNTSIYKMLINSDSIFSDILTLTALIMYCIIILVAGVTIVILLGASLMYELGWLDFGSYKDFKIMYYSEFVLFTTLLYIYFDSLRTIENKKTDYFFIQVSNFACCLLATTLINSTFHLYRLETKHNVNFEIVAKSQIENSINTQSEEFYLYTDGFVILHNYKNYVFIAPYYESIENDGDISIDLNKMIMVENIGLTSTSTHFNNSTVIHKDTVDYTK